MKRFIPIIVIVVVGLSFFLSKQKPDLADQVLVEESIEEEDDLSIVFADETSEEIDDEALGEVIVDIKGAVVHPGIYEIAANERVQAVIDLAGGLTKDADNNQINLAQKVQDEMVIYVPEEGEVDHPLSQLPSMPADSNEISEDGVIQINSADVSELTELQGIGPAKAEAIIAYRDEHGPFQQVEDLLEVSGIGEKTLENIKDQIVVP